MERLRDKLEGIVEEIIVGGSKNVDREGYHYVLVKSDDFIYAFEKSKFEEAVLDGLNDLVIYDIGELVIDMMEEFELAECTQVKVISDENGQLELISENDNNKEAVNGYMIYPYEVYEHLL